MKRLDSYPSGSKRSCTCIQLGHAQVSLALQTPYPSKQNTAASSALLTLMEQQEERIRWLGPVDRKRQLGEGADKWVSLGNIHRCECEGRRGRRWVKGGEGVCQLRSVHWENSMPWLKSTTVRGATDRFLLKKTPDSFFSKTNCENVCNFLAKLLRLNCGNKWNYICFPQFIKKQK